MKNINCYCIKKQKFIKSTNCNQKCDLILKCSNITVCLRCEKMQTCDLNKLNNDNIFQRLDCGYKLSYGE